MGKPFQTEIENMPYTIRTVFKQGISPSLENLIANQCNLPLLVVGSGGSFSAAHFIAKIHENRTGHIAKAITPLDLFFSTVNPKNHAILFLTASGNNKDIVNSFEIAVKREFAQIGIVCSSLNSKIVEKAKAFSSYVNWFEYSNPAGKDGFLAVNSLLSTSILLGKGYEAFETPTNSILKSVIEEPHFDSVLLDRIFRLETIVALGGEWTWPAVIDLESKFTEAALGTILLSDIRNFGHGRHHWFDKRGTASALVVFTNPALEKIAKKTVDLLPEEIPHIILKTNIRGPLGTIDLFKQVFYLVYEAGKRIGIDPGKPGVPMFGRKIYHIAMPKLTGGIYTNRKAWVYRKAIISNDTTEHTEEYLQIFLDSLKEITFSGVVFDYDGTICDSAERFLQLKPEMVTALNSLLKRDIILGVATGRGKSVQKGLREAIQERYWDKVLVGNYNGSIILRLSEEIPDLSNCCSKQIAEARASFEKDELLKTRADITVRGKQMSVIPQSNLFREAIIRRVLELCVKHPNLKTVMSDHSIDVLDNDVSKTQVIKAVQSLINLQHGKILAIGDQGQYGGNDFEFLSEPFSLSVDKISSSPNSCWNLSPIGLRGTAAVLSIINTFKIEYNSFLLSVDHLERQ
jgi:HAD superfamily hydrolase (TIGR01484 family)